MIWRPFRCGRRWPAGRYLAAGSSSEDLALVDHVGQDQRGEHLGNRADLEQRITVDLRAGTGAACDDALAVRPQHAHHDPLPNALGVAIGDQPGNVGIGRQLPVGRKRLRRRRDPEQQRPASPDLAPFALPQSALRVPLSLVAAADAGRGERQAARYADDLGERQAGHALRRAVHRPAEGTGIVALDMHDHRQEISRRELDYADPVAGSLLRRRGGGNHDC